MFLTILRGLDHACPGYQSKGNEHNFHFDFLRKQSDDLRDDKSDFTRIFFTNGVTDLSVHFIITVA